VRSSAAAPIAARATARHASSIVARTNLVRVWELTMATTEVAPVATVSTTDVQPWFSISEASV
jgi:hypothetical protein